jgi:hypothetical protein
VKRLLQLKAKLKLKQAESVIRVRNYGTAARALTRTIEEIKALKERIKNEEFKLESVKQPVKHDV